MNYLNNASIFDICQAHMQLESDYNVGGIVWERPSNVRRNASTGAQLHRMGFNPGMRWVDICSEDNDYEDGEVRDIYLTKVLEWGLPIDDEMRAFMTERFTSEFLNSFDTWVKK